MQNNNNTQAQPQAQADKGYASIWRRQNGKVKASGTIRVSPETLISWAKLPPDQYGKIELDLVLFHNDRGKSDKAPQFTGYLQLPSPKPPKAADNGRPIDQYEDNL